MDEIEAISNMSFA